MPRTNFRLGIVSATLTAMICARHWCSPRRIYDLVIRHLSLFILMGAGALTADEQPAQQQPAPPIHWGDEVPPGWNGDWPEQLKTVPERTSYTRTISTLDLHQW